MTRLHTLATRLLAVILTVQVIPLPAPPPTGQLVQGCRL